MPMTTLVLTVLGDDRAGLVSAVSAPLKAHGASWERSQMARLAGKFAGIVEVSVDTASVDALSLDLRALAGQGLSVHAERTDVGLAAATGRAGGDGADGAPVTRLSLELIGDDRPGIVADISALLAEAGVSIEELSTQVREAPMAGGLLFEAHATLTAPASGDNVVLRNALEELADELMVDLTLAAED
jgi:glycine cleavage system regulatory protein